MKELTNVRSKPRYEAADSLRGIAALGVALHHLQVASHIYFWPIVRNAFLFVEFFFVLSGFVIAHAYLSRIENKSDAISFMIKRVGRVWPLHVCLLFVFVATEIILFVVAQKVALPLPRPPFSEDRTVLGIPINFLMLNGIVPYQGAGWNGPSWSVSVELLAYSTFAGSLMMGGQSARKCQWVLMVIAAIALLLVGSPPRVARCVFSFYLGVELWRNRDIANRLPATVFEIAALLGSLLVLSVGDFPGRFVICPLVFAAAILSVTSEKGLIAKLLKHRALLALGQTSYSIYMVHFFIAFVLTNVVKLVGKITNTPSILPGTDLATIGNSPWLMDAVTFAYILVVIMVSRVTYKWIEKPGMAYSTALANRLKSGGVKQLQPAI